MSSATATERQRRDRGEGRARRPSGAAAEPAGDFAASEHIAGESSAAGPVYLNTAAADA